jgi:hypothetical protein
VAATLLTGFAKLCFAHVTLNLRLAWGIEMSLASRAYPSARYAKFTLIPNAKLRFSVTCGGVKSSLLCTRSSATLLVHFSGGA